MRFALLAAASTLLVGFATLACSGSASTDDGSETPAAENDVNSGTATTTPTTGAATSTTPTVDDAGTIALDASTNTGDAGTACLADSLHETEANDTTANIVPATTGSFCGRLNANDVDVFSFTMPAQVGRWSVNFDKLIPVDGSVRFGVEADVNGQQFDFQGRWPFVAGGVYTFKLRAGTYAPTTAALDYKVTLTFAQ